jgi:Amt family ammonium transporter
MENNIFELQYAIDTFYFLICGALVMWMAAGFAMLEAGLVRAKNTTEILTKNVALFAIACTMYMICGYDFMYDGGLFLADVETTGGIDVAAALAASAENGFDGDSVYSGASDFFFQVVFVATAISFLVFAVIMTGFIYPIEGGWTWGGKEVPGIGALDYSDYAGSGIVHLAGAVAALTGVILLGARKGKYSADGKAQAIPGANLPLATLGTFILWMGWFGFNGGSTLKLGGIAVANEVANVFMNTNAAASGGLIAALLVARVLFGKADLTMALNGALAGLVAITADPASQSALMSTIIGAIGGVIVVFSILTLDKMKIDDPVGAISVHGVVGIFGVLAVAIFGDASFGGQLLGLAVIIVWVGVTSFIAWFVIKMVMGLRVSEDDEMKGVDLSECGMEAYPEFTK